MKKLLAFLLCLSMLLPLASCDKDDTPQPQKETPPTEESTKATDGDKGDTEQEEKLSDTPSDTPTDLTPGVFFKLDQRGFGYYYEIYDKQGAVVRSEESNRPTQIAMVGEKLVEIRIGMGSGIVLCTYYDVENDRFSEEYSYVAAVSNNLIAYVDTSMKDPMYNRTLVVRDIFDKSVFYKSFGLDFSEMTVMPIQSAMFTEGENELEVVYWSGRPAIALSITLPIRRSPNEGEALSVAEMAMQEYERVLKGEIKVYETDIEEYSDLKDCKTPYNGVPLCELESLKYVYMDVDGDLVNELVIACGGDTLILHYYRGSIFVYSFTFRSLNSLNTDGSYSWNHTGSDFEYGESKLYFEGEALKTKGLWRIVNDGEPNAAYYIGDKQVTQEEILKYIQDNPKTEVEFLPLAVTWFNEISADEALQIAAEHWASFNPTENRYWISRGANDWAPESVYVIVMQCLVEDHWSTIDEIWIDKTTGETITPSEPPSVG